ncbi:oxidoreductase [Oleiphilus sp. HI0071]|uniref:SDR family NAD(P)-dependent oxidoreductase n=1 Tax=Oleiphilus sp. HI0080 TaxID=1822255 RepID=UPI0007C3493F|nr:SDR family NAD(P)-dependent oxidoreductase [Oleiphilus sp. HI0080]KZY62234.1 oxidoreductase [Oleiphilus sp. HI0065]KZY78553.1 oxidoreductase [Oleiphilus sp. HI0071]KZZ00858.1 oxidoreductase [Oleiphilus sp. HI0073]KZZ48210.1 oxidoreductase [Oleiphilus sp. HI0122]KZZ48414.1 oxidoreductase [Oleiphilus sp. HI0118]KZZ79310.1 oxidoreductase [Oleiphilus sp. HI0133]
MNKILITGATDGIGLETAKLLAAKGHHLLIHGRSEQKLADTETALHDCAPNTLIDTYRADLSRFDDIQSLLVSITSDHSSIDIIINNAGVLKTPTPITPEGFDVRFVVNTFAPFILAKGLIPSLSSDGRIINLSSAAQAPINIDAMEGNVVLSEAFQAYAQSKLALTIWSQELAKDLSNSQVSVAVNPGSLLASKMVKEGFGVAGNDLSVGANILVRAALSEEFARASGQYYDNDEQQFAPPHADATNPAICEQVMASIHKITSQFC